MDPFLPCHVPRGVLPGARDHQLWALSHGIPVLLLLQLCHAGWHGSSVALWDWVQDGSVTCQAVVRHESWPRTGLTWVVPLAIQCFCLLVCPEPPVGTRVDWGGALD